MAGSRRKREECWDDAYDSRHDAGRSTRSVMIFELDDGVFLADFVLFTSLLLVFYVRNGIV